VRCDQVRIVSGHLKLRSSERIVHLGRRFQAAYTRSSSGPCRSDGARLKARRQSFQFPEISLCGQAAVRLTNCAP
jgi:hypothetical protein